MKLVEVASFEVAHAHLSWPWVAFDASGSRFAFSTSPRHIATRVLRDGAVTEGPSFSFPDELTARAFTLDPSGTSIAAIAGEDGRTVVTNGASTQRSSVGTLVGPGFAAKAIAFDRSGARLWLSAESATETAITLLDARTHAVLGAVRSAAFPPPSMHELMLHPRSDSLLLVAACGEDGTFARVATWTGDRVDAVVTALDDGSIPAGFVGFSTDGARVHLAEADELRTHAWPGLEELSSVEFADDFVSSFAGAVLGGQILVDGEDSEAREDAVMVFDTSALRGTLAVPPVPAGMWAGRLGADAIVTVESKGEPSRGRVIRLRD
jgi:hypothetical protein